jgi:hypothetical protein
MEIFIFLIIYIYIWARPAQIIGSSLGKLGWADLSLTNLFFIFLFLGRVESGLAVRAGPKQARLRIGG